MKEIRKLLGVKGFQAVFLCFLSMVLSELWLYSDSRCSFGHSVRIGLYESPFIRAHTK